MEKLGHVWKWEKSGQSRDRGHGEEGSAWKPSRRRRNGRGVWGWGAGSSNSEKKGLPPGLAIWASSRLRSADRGHRLEGRDGAGGLEAAPTVLRSALLAPGERMSHLCHLVRTTCLFMSLTSQIRQASLLFPWGFI